MPRGQSDGDVVVDILMDDSQARKYWESFSQYTNMSAKQLTRVLERELSRSANALNILDQGFKEINAELKDLRHQRLELNFDQSKLDLLEKTKSNINIVKQKIEELNSQKISLISKGVKGSGLSIDEWKGQLNEIRSQIDGLNQQKAILEKTSSVLDRQHRQYNRLTQAIEETKQARRDVYNMTKEESVNFDLMNQKYIELNKDAREQDKTQKSIEHHTRNTKAHTSHIGANIKSGVAKLALGLKKVISLSLALLGIRSLFTGITSALRTWMNSEDELAKKTKANLESLKLNFAQILQPALQWVINAFNNILALLGAVIRQFTKLNIFAKKTATSTGATSKNMQNTLASFDKIDVLQKNDGGGGGDGAVEPFDMESLMTKYEDLAKKIKEIFETIFDPVKKAWENKGEGVINSIKSSFESLKGLGEAVGGSIFEVWTNGTGQTTIETILDIFRNIFGIVGKIADAWKNAWNNDNNGTKIIQNVWDALNDVLGIIETITGVLEKVYQSEGYQQFANAIVKAGEVISQGIKLIADTFRDVVGEHGDEWGDKLSSIFGNLGKVIEVISGAFEKLFGGQDFKDFYHDYIEILADAVDVLLDWWDVLSKLLVLIVDPNWENLKSLGESIGTFADDVNGTGFDLNEFMKKIPNWTMLLPRRRSNSIR